ncbi:maleylpyruvate isomerase family mycothiol-dependent enzyme [Streptomyces sp. NPDC054842]
MNPGELLERSLAYALGSVALVTPGSLGGPTPCAGWDLGELLRHLDDSVDALHEAVSGGRVGLCPAPAAADPVCAFRERACAVLGAWAVASGEVPSARPVAVADAALELGVVAVVGAVEGTAHGWDVGRACGRRRPVPAAPAAALLPLARCVVGDADRGPRFAAPVGVAAGAGPDERLLAFLGRDARRGGLPGGPARTARGGSPYGGDRGGTPIRRGSRRNTVRRGSRRLLSGLRAGLPSVSDPVISRREPSWLPRCRAGVRPDRDATSPPRRGYTVAPAGLGALLCSLDVVVVATALPALRAGFGASLSHVRGRVRVGAEGVGGGGGRSVAAAFAPSRA